MVNLATELESGFDDLSMSSNDEEEFRSCDRNDSISANLGSHMKQVATRKKNFFMNFSFTLRVNERAKVSSISL